MKKYLKLFQFLLPILAVLLIETLLFKSNYVSGTWLTGWDSTQPELNISEHFSRNLGAVWQEYRGLGVLDGMAHAANLVHTGYIWFLSQFLEASIVRYFFVFLMHGLGGLGIYYLVRFLFKKEVEPLKTLVASIASVFYLFNPATIQMFYAPLELFIIHFGFLPWLILTLLKYLESGKKKDLLLLFAVNLLAVSQAHVPTIFIVYAFFVAIVLAFHLIKNHKNNIKAAVLVIIVLFATNAFWGLPYIYSAYKNASTITSAKINELSNPEIVLRNEAFGDLKNVALMRGFSLDYEDWKGDNEFGYQMETWRNYWQKPPIELFGLVLFGLAIAGLTLAVLTKEKTVYPFIAIFAFSILNLGARIPLISTVRSLIWNYSPYYEEVFRFAFTKFATVYALSFAVLSAYALVRIFSFRILKSLSPILAIMFLAGLILESLPAFRGEFLYDKLKLEIPQEYFEAFNFFDKPENKGRVAILPQPTFWNWEYSRWGYRGSGFIWQGISSPLLHRSFDPWSSQNEGYYQEIADAIYRKDLADFENVLSKYRIRWILMDENIFQPGGWSEALYYDEVKSLINSSDRINEIQTFDSLSLYENHIFVGRNDEYIRGPKLVGSPTSDDFSYLRKDPNYYFGIDYINGTGIYHPFASVLSARPTDVRMEDGRLIWERDIKEGTAYIDLGPWVPLEGLAPVDLYASYQGGGSVKFRIVGLYPIIKLDGKVISETSEGDFTIPMSGSTEKILLSFGDNNYFEISKGASEQYVGAILLPQSTEISLKIYSVPDDIYFDLYPNFDGEEVRKCWEREGRETRTKATLIDGEINLTSRDATACIGARLPMEFTGPTLLSVTLEHESTTDTPPDTCLTKEGSPGCIGVSPFYQTGSSHDWAEVTTFYETQSGGVYWLDLLSRAKDEEGDESSISYKNVVVKTYPSVTQTGVRLEDSFAPKEGKIEIKDAKRISLELPLGKEQGLIKKEVWSQNRGGEEAENCSIFGTGEVKKKVDSSGITYESEDRGINCDHFVYSGLVQNQGYLLRIKGENRRGRSLKFVLNNHATHHNDLEDLVPTGSFDEYYALLPGTNPKGEYTFVPETRSFGPEKSVNFLEEIGFLPIPVNWMSRIVLVRGATSNPQNLRIKNFQILPHYKINSWANGWLVENSKLKTQNSKIYIIFWPQLLEFLGFALLFAGLGFVLSTKEGVVDNETKNKYNYPV